MDFWEKSVFDFWASCGVQVLFAVGAIIFVLGHG